MFGLDVGLDWHTSMKPEIYRQVIDRLVEVCRRGQGQGGPKRVRKGQWNPNATEDFIPEQHEVNLLLSELSVEQRAILARMLQDQFSGGVFETLKVLEELEIEPFVDGYEGSPYHDFIGRLGEDPWKWPDDKG